MWEYLPVLLLLACPLMMIFMMRGMGGMSHGSMNHGGSTRPDAEGAPDAPERIAALEAEVAALRAQQPAPTRDRVRSS